VEEMKKFIVTGLIIFVLINILSLAGGAKAASLLPNLTTTFMPVYLTKAPSDTIRYVGPAPVLQLALPGQSGYINFSKMKFEVGDSVYAFSIFDAAKVDSNGYIWQDQFRFAKNAIVAGFNPDGMVRVKLNGDDHELFVIYESAPQSAVIYPRAQ
jgi:hypothetical protein